MNRTRSVWLSIALLCAALLAGCGSSTSTSTSSTPAAATQPASTSTSTSTSTSAATTPSTTAPTTTTGGRAASTKGLAAAVCKSASARSALKSKMKTRIEEICRAYEHGDEAKAREVAKKACLEAIEAIPGSSAAKQRAKASCEAKK